MTLFKGMQNNLKTINILVPYSDYEPDRRSETTCQAVRLLIGYLVNTTARFELIQIFCAVKKKY